MTASVQNNGWSQRRTSKAARLARIAPWMKGSVLDPAAIVEALQALLEPGDAVALEGDNQKQADFLSRSLVQVDPAKVDDLHLLISSVSRPGHLTLFERGIARKIDLAFAGPQSVRLAQFVADGRRELGTNLLIEMAPGHVSTNLVAESITGVRAISAADRGLRYAAIVVARESRGS
jgi:malonate decarboxylase alpha subunit